MVHLTKSLPMGHAEPCSIFIFGDLQVGGSGFNKETWEQFRNEFKSTPNAWAIGLGDYDDFTRPSLRPLLQGALGRDESARAHLDKIVCKASDDTLKLMDFLDHKLLLVHEGHHNWVMLSGINTDQRIASALHAPYGGFSATLRLSLIGPHKINRGSHHVYTILSCHGNANGRKTGGAINWLEGNLVSSFDADQYIMGHGCKHANFIPYARNRVRRVGAPGLEKTLPRCLVVGGFSEGYTDGWKSSYVERAGMSPQPLGWGIIRFKLVNRKAMRDIHGLPMRGSQTLDIEQLNRHPFD